MALQEGRDGCRQLTTKLDQLREWDVRRTELEIHGRVL